MLIEVKNWSVGANHITCIVYARLWFVNQIEVVDRNIICENQAIPFSVWQLQHNVVRIVVTPNKSVPNEMQNQNYVELVQCEINLLPCAIKSFRKQISCCAGHVNFGICHPHLFDCIKR